MRGVTKNKGGYINMNAETLSILIELLAYVAVVREFAFIVSAITLVQQCTSAAEIWCFAFVKHRHKDRGTILVRQGKRWYEVECCLFNKCAVITYL